MQDLNVTEAAAEKALALLARSEGGEGALRIRVKDGGCSGMRYELLFDHAADADQRFEGHGLTVVVDPESAQWLEGITLDFSDDMNDAGFKIENPRASDTCGCGESFNVV